MPECQECELWDQLTQVQIPACTLLHYVMFFKLRLKSIFQVVYRKTRLDDPQVACNSKFPQSQAVPPCPQIMSSYILARLLHMAELVTVICISGSLTLRLAWGKDQGWVIRISLQIFHIVNTSLPPPHCTPTTHTPGGHFQWQMSAIYVSVMFLG